MSAAGGQPASGAPGPGAVPPRCPSCATPLTNGGAAERLCPVCLFGLALSPAEADEGRTAASDATAHSGSSGLTPGRVLGDRYRIRSFLGRGGMGDVWRGYDLKLRADVALKAVRADLPSGHRALERLRREVRLARQVSSPNVCRVFDLVEIEGHELVCMEYVDGLTLARLLRERAPLPFDEAQEIASQFLAGLEAIHRAGLVHRDLKPENVMVTRAGRVVVMDLGVAHWARAVSGSTAGTPPFMSPEQARGESVDARADVFAAGVVLAEMVDPGGVATDTARAGVWEAIAADPPRIAETPWAGVIRQAVSADRDRRHESAFALARALEEVTLRAAGADDARPYPGLASFASQDAAFFFGREVEVEAVWRKLRRPQLLGLIGPSGSGKSSFLRAGLIPARPEGWDAVITAPGPSPFAALAQAFAPRLESDREALAEIPRFEDPDVALSMVGRWRRHHANGLVVVDQFEELFTQSPEPVQEAYARLLHRLVLEADVHVLLSMRDDFLFHCQQFEHLQAIFAELTPLGAPTGAALRRAVVQPALKCGYRFEDEALVEAMIAEVEGERGALPLLAFACAQLWERRDRERGVLSRAAYAEIGGVAGALAQHAEATLDRIGHDKLALVREIFRNLATADGTRAARDRHELLSVFPPGERETVGAILDALVGSRLLVSYQAEGESPRLEIVHESLLTRWPRLARWRAQETEAAVLRDQLRQAAQVWDQRQRAEDFLWTGIAYREYQLWRERYPGGLTALEESFARASTALAQRRRRRRTIGAAAAFVALAVGLAVVTALRQQAVAQARRAEASKLLAFGQVELEASPTAALAYAIKSLELDDSHAARVFALKALATGPPASVHLVDVRQTGSVKRTVFSPDGAWAAVMTGNQTLHVLSRDGATRLDLQPFPAGTGEVSAVFDSAGEHLYGAKHGIVRVWRVPGFDLVETRAVGGTHTLLRTTRAGVLATTRTSDEPREVVVAALAVGAPPRAVDRFRGFTTWAIDPAGRSVALAREKTIYLRALGGKVDSGREIGRYEGQPQLLFHPAGDRLAVYDDASRQIRLWPTQGGAEGPIRALTAPFEPLSNFTFDLAGRRLAAVGTTSAGALRADLWDLGAPADAAPRGFPAKVGGFVYEATFSPDGRWLATNTFLAVCLWPLSRSEPRILRGHQVGVEDVRFTPDSARLVSVDRSGRVREWALDGVTIGRNLARVAELNQNVLLDMDRQGRFVAVTQSEGAAIVSLSDGKTRALRGFAGSTGISAIAIDPEGRRVAAASANGARSEKVIRVWDLQTGQVRTLGPTEQAGESWSGQVWGLGFLADGSLVSAGDAGLLRWSLSSGAHELIAPSYIQSHLTVFPDGRSVVYTVGSQREAGAVAGRAIQFISVAVTDVAARTSKVLRSHGGRIMPIAVDPSGRIVVSGSRDGIVRVGPVTGEEPHLLIGHEGFVHTVDISPDGRWIASGGADRTVRVWPMPDLSKPPLHTLPLSELLPMLKALTNVRVVEESSSTLVASLRTGRGAGYELDIEPFRGWAEVPEP